MRRALLAIILLPALASAETLQTALLTVSGAESGWAARMDCKSVTIVHDGPWLGGQYTEQGLVCVDRCGPNSKNSPPRPGFAKGPMMLMRMIQCRLVRWSRGFG